MVKFVRSLLAGAALSVVAACGFIEDQQAETPESAPGVTPIGGPGRPANLAEATVGDSNVALWVVSDEDTILYLIGTVHLMKEGVEWRTDDIRIAFDNADAVFLEADVFSREAQRAMGLLVSETAELKNGKTLSSFYTDKERDHVDEVLRTMDLSMTDLDNFRPWFASMQLSMQALMAAGGDPSSGADVLIARDMLMRRRPLRYLETAAEQIALLASGNDAHDAQYLLELIDDLEEGEAYYADLMGAWYTGDTGRIDYLINDAFTNYPDLRQRLLVDRNNSWAQQLDRVLTDEVGVFVAAVGAGHLAGRDSLQDILTSRGYDVSRVSND